jgi:predicted RNase H-like nuclease (RuvC/YqgF family)
MALRTFLYFIYFCALAGLLFWLYFAYTNERELAESVRTLKSRNGVLREEVEQLQVTVESARSAVESLLTEQKKLESESERLKVKVNELEVMWEVAKQCKRDFEEMSGEIDTLKRELSRIKSGNR